MTDHHIVILGDSGEPDEDREMSEREKYYDAEIAPRLLEVMKLCDAQGMGIVAQVEYETGNYGLSVNLEEDSTLAMRFLLMCARARQNIDSFLISVIRYCNKEGISTESSMFLNSRALNPYKTRTEP